jgi:hypothetical protein
MTPHPEAQPGRCRACGRWIEAVTGRWGYCIRPYCVMMGDYQTITRPAPDRSAEISAHARGVLTHPAQKD